MTHTPLDRAIAEQSNLVGLLAARICELERFACRLFTDGLESGNVAQAEKFLAAGECVMDNVAIHRARLAYRAAAWRRLLAARAKMPAGKP